MRNIKLTLEYDGSRFFGFQKQNSRRTVQSELEGALRKLFQKTVKVIAAGRTDSGVHAEAQVVNFRVHSKIPISKIRLGLNHYLPEDLAVRDAKEVSPSFHSQFSAQWKVYEYRILNARGRSPLERFRAYHVPYALDLAAMKRAARMLIGRHDFRAFESGGGRRKSAVRTMKKLAIKKHGAFISITVQADGFLYKMVRSLVGTLLEVGRGRLQVSDLKKLFMIKDRRYAGPTVPPQGLTLKAVIT